MHKEITFVSMMSSSPWGGSESLWSQTALRLVDKGYAVKASICRWPKQAPQAVALAKHGVKISERIQQPEQLPNDSISKRVQSILNPLTRKRAHYAFNRWLKQQRTDMLCISNGGIGDDMDIMESCSNSGLPYTIIIQANTESWWPHDATADRLIKIYRSAKRVFFVSQRNLQLLENQLGIKLPNAEVVRNPYNVPRDIRIPWPLIYPEVKLACIGRLDPRSKGQDLLLQILASEPWFSRPLSVSFFGDGPSAQGLRRLAERLQLASRVRFCGHVNRIEAIWETHHALILPSRFEGLPLVVVEAMICGRPVVVTDVAGNTEIVQDDITGFVAEAPTIKHLSLALERAWSNRARWELMGKTAAEKIREVIPEDPSEDFALKLISLVESV